MVAASQVPPAQLVNLRRRQFPMEKSGLEVQLSYCPPPHLTNSHPDDPRHIIVSEEYFYERMDMFFKTLPFQHDHMIE